MHNTKTQKLTHLVIAMLSSALVFFLLAKEVVKEVKESSEFVEWFTSKRNLSKTYSFAS